jgi:hypothetical protein
LAVHASAVRREGAAIPAETILAVVERAARAPRSRVAVAGQAPSRRAGLLGRLKGLFRR